MHFREVHAGRQPDRAPADLPEGRQGGRLRRHRQGLRGLRGRVGRAHEEEVDAAAGAQPRCSTSRSSSPPPRSTRSSSSAPTTSAPATKGEDAYALLHDALEQAGRAGVGRWVFHNREHTVVDPRRSATCWRCTRCASPTSSSTRTTSTSRASAASRPSGRSRWRTRSSTGCTPSSTRPHYKDDYREAVLDAGQGARPQGKHIEPPAESREAADDLLAALEASLRAPDAPLALVRLAELRARQRARSALQRRRATSTSTSASCTRRTTRPSRSSASAPRRTRGPVRGDRAAATRPTTARWSSSPTTSSRRRAAQDADDRDRGVRRPRGRRPDLLRPPVRAHAGGRRRRHAARVPAAARGHGQTERAALGRFVMRTKEYLVLVRARDGRLALTTMLLHDEVRATEGHPDADEGARRRRRRSTGASKLIEAMPWTGTRRATRTGTGRG